MAESVPLGRLPFEIREEVYVKLRDRVPGRKISAWLVTKGYGPYTDKQFSKFRHSKNLYPAWLAQQQKLAERRERAEAFRREFAADGMAVLDKRLVEVADALSDPDIPATKAGPILVAVKRAFNEDRKLSQGDRKVVVDEKNSAREDAKFRYTVAKEALAILQDRKAKEIAEDRSLTREQQLAAIVRRIDEMVAEGCA